MAEEEKPTVRSSSTPQLMTCTPSVLNPDGLQVVEQENETALLGTLVHALCEKLVMTGAYDLADLKQRLNEADYDRASLLFNNFLAVWRVASVHMRRPVAEWDFRVELSHCILTGHIDLHYAEQDRAFVLDYKTGRQHEDHYHQMAAYAYGIWAGQGKPENYTVYVTSVYLEDNAVKPYTFTTAQLLEWEKELAVKIMDLRYTAGRKCAFCQLQDTCPAYRVYGANARAYLMENQNIPMPTWEAMTPEDRGALVDAMYVLEKAIDRVKLGLRNLVRERGAVDISGGKEYVLVETKERQIDTEKALPILKARIGAAAIRRHSRIPLDAVLSEFAAKAAKGKKTVARKELFEELDKAGAIVHSTTTRMWRRPKGEQVLNS